MARIVMKFGGTSVADLDRIRGAARHVKREVDAGHQVAVVVSAMAGATNQLVDWTRSMSPLHDAREYDVVVSAGEQVTAGLLAIALHDMGVAARSWMGWQVPVKTDAAHGAARITDMDSRILLDRLAQGQVAVVAGFQGLGPDNRVTTLGRGGGGAAGGGGGGGRAGGGGGWVCGGGGARRPYRPWSFISIQFSTSYTRPTLASCRRPGDFPASRSRRCWRWRRWAPE
jgi:hypothetical protein